MDKFLEKAIKRARAYWFIDGFAEILVGVFFLLIGGIVIAAGTVLQESFFEKFVLLTAEISIAKAVGILLGITALWWLKNRITYPRTGLIRGKRLSLGQTLNFLLSAALAATTLLAIFALVLFLTPASRNALFTLPGWFPVLIGVFWGGLCVWAAVYFGLGRFYLLAAGTLIAGIVIGVWQFSAGMPAAFDLSPISSWASLPADAVRAIILSLSQAFTSIGWMTLATGALFLATGKITFLRYWLAHPEPEQEAS